MMQGLWCGTLRTTMSKTFQYTYQGVSAQSIQKMRDGYEKERVLPNAIFEYLIKAEIPHDAVQDFLAPVYDHISDPYLLDDMEKAVGRILKSFNKKEKILIYADYDADGIPGAVLLSEFFHEIGYGEYVDVYIPHRHSEGYGFHAHVLEYAQEKDIGLIITIDVGSTEVATVKLFQDANIDVIITDHHEIPEQMPGAFALVNPKRGNYPDPMICGAAVAWQLVRALLTKMREFESSLPEYITIPVEGWEKWQLDLVGIATLSDMVPLHKENRIFAWYGMYVLSKTRRKSLQMLSAALRLPLVHMTPKDVVFSITPLINAASRMDHPMQAFTLLSSKDPVVIQTQIKHLQSINRKRKTVVAQIMKHVHSMMSDREETSSVIVVGDRSWNLGVVGLIASKITEFYNAHAFVWGEHDKNTLKGSCRSSTDDISVYAMMKEASDAFIHYGGHDAAGGFALDPRNVHDLEKKLNAAYQIQKTTLEKTSDTTKEKKKAVDLMPRINDLMPSFFQKLSVLGPHGAAHPDPRVAIHGEVSGISTFGKENQHLTIIVRDEMGNTIKGIKFYTDINDFSVKPESGRPMYMIGALEVSRFAGRLEYRMMIEDFVRAVEILEK